LLLKIFPELNQVLDTAHLLCRALLLEDVKERAFQSLNVESRLIDQHTQEEKHGLARDSLLLLDTKRHSHPDILV